MSERAETEVNGLDRCREAVAARIVAATENGSGVRIGVTWASLNSTVLMSLDGDERFYSASTMKTAVMVAAERAIEAGILAETDEVALTTAFTSMTGEPYALDTEDADLELARDEGVTTVRRLIERMITVSSNEATNLLLKRLGEALRQAQPGADGESPTDVRSALATDVRSALAAGVGAAGEATALLGATNSRLERPIGDSQSQLAGLTNMVTSTDLAIGLGRLVSGKVAGPAATTRMTETLRRQTYGESIGAGLPTGVEWGGKSGWMDDIRHDSAVVWPPDAPPYCLAVCTQGLDNEIEPTQDPTDDRNPAVTLIRDLSALIYAHRQAGADRMDDHRHAGDTT